MKKRDQAVHVETWRHGDGYPSMAGRIAAGILITLLAAGCGRSPQTTFYTLTPVVPVSESSKLTGNAVAVAFAAVTLPELVDRPQLVVADAGSKVAILETRRWAEPLKSAVPRLLAENLSRLIGAEQVSCYPQHAADSTDYRIFVDFQRFEATETVVTVDALWSIRSVKAGKPLNGRSRITETIANAEYETLVAAYSRALAAVSRDLARSVQAIQTKE